MSENYEHIRFKEIMLMKCTFFLTSNQTIVLVIFQIQKFLEIKF